MTLGNQRQAKKVKPHLLWIPKLCSDLEFPALVTVWGAALAFLVDIKKKRKKKKMSRAGKFPPSSRNPSQGP